jgi:hypothetical protein
VPGGSGVPDNRWYDFFREVLGMPPAPGANGRTMFLTTCRL